MDVMPMIPCVRACVRACAPLVVYYPKCACVRACVCVEMGNPCVFSGVYDRGNECVNVCTSTLPCVCIGTDVCVNVNLYMGPTTLCVSFACPFSLVRSRLYSPLITVYRVTSVGVVFYRILSWCLDSAYYGIRKAYFISGGGGRVSVCRISIYFSFLFDSALTFASAMFNSPVFSCFVLYFFYFLHLLVCLSIFLGPQSIPEHNPDSKNRSLLFLA